MKLSVEEIRALVQHHALLLGDSRYWSGVHPTPDQEGEFIMAQATRLHQLGRELRKVEEGK